MFQFIKCSWFWLVDLLFDQTSQIRLGPCKGYLLVLDAQYTDQENGCQTMHKQKIQNDLILHLSWSTDLHNCWSKKQWATMNSIQVVTLHSPCTFLIGANRSINSIILYLRYTILTKHSFQWNKCNWNRCRLHLLTTDWSACTLIWSEFQITISQWCYPVVNTQAWLTQHTA